MSQNNKVFKTLIYSFSVNAAVSSSLYVKYRRNRTS
jgi:hypothetical protein